MTRGCEPDSMLLGVVGVEGDKLAGVQPVCCKWASVLAGDLELPYGSLAAELDG